MNISYDKFTREFVLGEVRYSKQAFLSYIQSDMLQASLEAHSGTFDVENDDDTTENADLIQYSNGGCNLLLYGVPGCGKSHYIDNKFHLNEENSERVVFHPDYTYSDFVGQIIPKIVKMENGKTDAITYAFVPGPFVKILEKCQNNSGMNYLVIEEINRGNAPAIFGDVFQLLDRDDFGNSKYWVNNDNISMYLFGEKKRVSLPSNLTILATMNTADQNVFTLDTAFKRRWKMKAIKNEFKDDDHANQTLCGTTVTWREFAEAINRQISILCSNGLGNEDKRLGVYFLMDNEMEDISIFAEKVLMYLWNDVFKFDREKIFDGGYTLFEDLLKDFYKYKFDVFNDEIWDVETGE